MTCLLSIQSKGNLTVITDEEIVDNTIIIMIAGHDTSSALLNFLVRILASDPSVFANIVQGLKLIHFSFFSLRFGPCK